MSHRVHLLYLLDKFRLLGQTASPVNVVGIKRFRLGVRHLSCSIILTAWHLAKLKKGLLLMAANFPPRNLANQTENVFKCADRVSPGDEPRNISSVKNLYLPFDTSNTSVHVRKNPFGAVIYKNTIQPGKVYHAFDGKRLVVEVGCDTIIYIHINPAQPAKHHRLFIQSEKAFSGDTTIRRDAAKIAKNTRHVETIAMYEMYFILGVLSTASIAAWLIVTGSDVTYLYASKRVVADASKKLSKSLLNELEIIGGYAPTLQAKIWEMITAELTNNATRAVKQLPKTIVTNEKIQAQTSGIIFGKWALPKGNPFNAWTIVSVLLIQAASNSVLKYPDAYIQSLVNQYKPLLEEMRQANPSQPLTMQKPVGTLVRLLGEAGVTVSHSEASAILKEITNNKIKAYKSLTNVLDAITEFKRVANR